VEVDLVVGVCGEEQLCIKAAGLLSFTVQGIGDLGCDGAT